MNIKLTKLVLLSCGSRLSRRFVRLSVSAAMFSLLSCVGTLAQTAGMSDQADLINRSSGIVVVVPEESFSVVRTDRVNNSRQMPDGSVAPRLPDPSQYLAGQLFKVRIVEVLKGESLKGGTVISVFVPGEVTTESVYLKAKWRYLIFLAPLKSANNEYASTILMRQGSQTISGPAFKPRFAYTIVDGSAGALHLTDGNLQLLQDIRSRVGK